MDEQLSLFLTEATGRRPEFMNVMELYVKADQDLLLSLAEDRRFERKHPGFQPRELGKYISMFANTAPDGGLICVGMEDDRTFTGCSHLSAERLNELEKASRTFCPEANVDSKRIRVIDAKGQDNFVLLFHVRYDPQHLIETSNGDAYKRIADTCHRLTPEEKVESKYLCGQLEREQEPSGLSYPVDFDTNSIDQYCRSFAEKKGLTQSHTKDDILVLSHLAKRTPGGLQANIACALLFAKDPNGIIPGAGIRFLRFEGESEGVGDKFNVVKDLRIDGVVTRQIEEAASIIRTQVRDFTRLGKDGKFFSAPEYPEMAWYEAIVNACVHRSYSLKNMPIFVKMFDDRIVIESPGAFPPLVTPQNIYDMHEPRNPHLMQAMYYLDYVKCAHEGTRRIRISMKQMALPEPEFRQEEVGGALVKVTLRNNISHRKVFVDSHAARLLGEHILGTLDDREKRVVNYLAEYDQISVSQAQLLIESSWPAAKKLLLGLVERGILVHNKRANLARDPAARYSLKFQNGKNKK